ncbi:hypothetical protein EI372_12005 [Vibrio fluvialis]|nr:hypothetical protein [Vibrio fluvialis]
MQDQHIFVQTHCAGIQQFLVHIRNIISLNLIINILKVIALDAAFLLSLVEGKWLTLREGETGYYQRL